MPIRSAYGAVPYPSLTFPQTNPDRLATMAAFFGMKPASPQHCRALELGCGDGTNLISFAHLFPESEFIGVDLVENQISVANETASTLALQNIEFLQRDLINVDTAELGKFDFIIAHGLYSWVPESVRERILQIYANCLSPNGVGYISYNAFPGSHIRQMIDQMMKYRVADITDPSERVQKA